MEKNILPALILGGAIVASTLIYSANNKFSLCEVMPAGAIKLNKKTGEVTYIAPNNGDFTEWVVK